jgi:anti-anti-sigma factor
MAASKDPRPCSIADTLALVGEKYSLLVLREVCLGNGRFDQLVRNIGAPRDILAARLRRLVENTALRLVVDLAEVTYLDSAGINLLFSVGGDLRDRQQDMHLVVRPGSPIERMLKIAGAADAFPTHATREDALPG